MTVACRGTARGESGSHARGPALLRQLLDDVEVELDPGARPEGSDETAVAVELEGLPDIARVVAAGRRNVSGQGEPGERGEGEIRCSSNRRLEGSATEDRHTVCESDVVDFLAREIATDPARLDVDDIGPACEGIGLTRNRTAARPEPIAPVRASEPRPARVTNSGQTLDHIFVTLATAQARPTGRPRRSTAASSTYAAPRSGSATSPTTSPGACSNPAASGLNYTLNCEEIP